MKKSENFVKLSEALSAGFLADNVLIILSKYTNKNPLNDGEKEFLNNIKETFKYLIPYSKQDPLEIAINHPFKAARSSEQLTETVMPNIKLIYLKRAEEYSELLDKIITGVRTEVTPLEEYFNELSKTTLGDVNKLINKREN